MHAAYVLLALAPLAAPAEIPREPGVYWEQTMEMQMGGGVAMPAQTSKVCLPRKQDWSRPPQQQEGQEECKLEDVKRSGNKLSWKMRCENGMSGRGEMTWTGDTYAGSSTLRTPMGEMKMVMKGRKVGGDCDANEMRREMASMQAEMEAQQGRSEQAMDAACDDAVESMDPMTLGAIPRCKSRTAAFCKRLETREGLGRVNEQGEAARREAARLCGKDLARVAAGLCPAAVKDHAKGGPRADEALAFVSASCPAEARPIAQRECAGRSYTDLEASMREFCTTYARELLDRGEAKPASGSKAKDEAVKQGKKVLRGLFGR